MKGDIDLIRNLNSGHYYYFMKIGNKWHKFNDCNIEIIPKMEFSNDSAYVLIYQKID